MSEPVRNSGSSRDVLNTLAWIRRQGFKAVPLHPQSKAAVSRNYVEPGYTTPADATWLKQNLGIGFVTGPSSTGPVDIDLDCEEAVFLARLFLPKTPARFGREGKPESHYLYRVTAAALDKFALTDPISKSTIIELRADGGHQTVAPGSLHEATGQVVTWSEFPFPDVPSVDDRLLERAVKMVAIATLLARYAWLPGQRNEVCKCVAGVFYFLDFTLEETQALVEALDKLCDSFDKTHAMTVASTYKKAAVDKKVTGSPSLRKLMPGKEAVVDRILEWAGSQQSNVVQEYNENWAVVTIEGKFRIARFEQRPSEPPTFFAERDFQASRRTDTVTIEGKRVKKALIWLDSPLRRSYDALDYMPGVVDHPTVLNLWTSWARLPDPDASCAAWLALLRDVICGKDEELTLWMLNWFANILREPMNKSMTAPVIIGRQGAGKSLLVTYFGAILGAGYTVATNPEHIFGKFNKHQASTILLHSEEALYGGDKLHRNVIKSMITDKFRLSEPKGLDARLVSNHLRLILTSNDQHAAPAETGDRRFTVIDMEDRKISPSHIKSVVDELEGKGPEALHHFLTSKFPYDPAVPRINVKNEALRSVQALNMPPIDAWWLSVLQIGVILPDYLSWATRPALDPWPQEVSSMAVLVAMRIAMRERNVRSTPNETGFALLMNKWLGVRLTRRHHSFANNSPDMAPPEARQLPLRQSTILNLPTLTEARKAFTVYLGGQPIAWDAPEPESDKPLHERF